MAASDDSDDRFTLADANRNLINDIEERFEERLNELEAENRALRRELAELKDDGGDW